MGPVLALEKELGQGFDAFPISPERLVGLIELVAAGTISQSVGKDVLRMMLERGETAARVVEDEGLTQVRDSDQLGRWVEEVLAANPDEVERFRNGEKRLQGFFMGQIMKASRGKADPAEASRLLARRLEGSIR